MKLNTYKDKSTINNINLEDILKELELEEIPIEHMSTIAGIVQASNSQVESYINVFLYGLNIGRTK